VFLKVFREGKTAEATFSQVGHRWGLNLMDETAVTVSFVVEEVTDAHTSKPLSANGAAYTSMG
jgi:hypothetical protein